jgi:ribosomal protein L40E
MSIDRTSVARLARRSCLEGGAIVKECPECGKRWPNDFTRCRDCGYQFFPRKTGTSAKGSISGMRECPRCHKICPDDVIFCDSCGYYFIYSAVQKTPDHKSSVPQRNTNDGAFAGERSLLFLALTIASLIFSVLWSLVSLSGANILFLVFPYETLSVQPVVGALLFGVNLYTLTLTSGWAHWNDLPVHKRAIALISLVSGLVAIIYMCSLCCYVLSLIQECSGGSEC